MQKDKLEAGLKLINAIFTMPPFEERKVDQTEINGLIISTVQIFDISEMEYETAVIDGTDNVYPVERYRTIEEAKIGHQKWIDNSKSIKTIIFLGYPGLTNDEEIVLEKKENVNDK